MREFIALLPAAVPAQQALLRDLAVSDGVRLKPEIAPAQLENWIAHCGENLDSRAQNRKAIQDLLLMARPLVRSDELAVRRHGVEAAWRALELAEGDAVLRADISAAFLVPYAIDGSDAGAPAIWFQPLWPRYGRIVTLEIQSPATIAAMNQKAQTAPVEGPPIQIAPGNALTVPFLKVMATNPNPRQNWAIYRLARLYRAQHQPQLASQWFRRLSFGDGAGIFLRQQSLYHFGDPTSNPRAPRVIDAAKDEKAAGDLAGNALLAWDNLRHLMPRDVSAAQAAFIAELRARADQTTAPKRPEIYRQLAQTLENARFVQVADEDAHRATYGEADQAISTAFSALLQADGAENFYYFKAQDDWNLLSRASLLFALPHLPWLSGVNYNYRSRYEAARGAAPYFVGAGDLRLGLPALELWSALAYEGNHYEQSLDKTADLLEKNGRLEDALLCIEAIPRTSGLAGDYTWKAPPLRARWSQLVAEVDHSAVVTEYQPTESATPAD